MDKKIPKIIRGIKRGIYFGLISTIGILGFLYYLAINLPSTDELINPVYDLPTELYDRNGKLITKFYTKNRVLIPIGKVPRVMIQALLSIEDARFYHHYGIDPIRIAGAFIADVKAMSFVEGASTLTQQTAKMFLLDSDKKIIRKLKELLLALKIENKFSKNRILWLYLNKSFFGHNAYGIEAAAQSYFSKTAEELTLPEAALLAGVLQAPSKWSPTRNKERATKRRNLVLRQMRYFNAIDDVELKAALETPIRLKLNKN
ncbi:MAG: penicillin-binding protein, partial [Proteobacteria bacterium]|nr:penicillin-binding protein [Pseudomonadota bacterium]